MSNKWTKTSASLLTLALAASLTACGASKSNEGTGTTSPGATTNTAKGDKVTIELAISKASQDSAFVNADLLKQFEDQTNIHVNLQLLPAEQVTTVLQTKLAVGDTPDVVQYNLAAATHDLNLERNFEILDNEPWVSRLLNKDVLSASGHVYSFHISQDTGMQGVVYNKDIFNDLGISIPKNYDEFVAAAEKIKASGITPIFMPFKDMWATNIWTAAAFADYASKNDPTLWDDINANKKKWTDTPEFEKIIDQQYQLYKKGLTNSDALSDSYDMSVGKFLNKEVAMMFMGDWLIQDVANKDPNMHLGLFPIPYANDAKMGASPLGGQLFIPKKAKHMEEAKKFLDFIASKDVAQKIVTDQKYVSNLNDVTTPELPAYKQELVDQYITPKKTVITSDAYMLVDISEQYRYYQDIYAGTKTPKKALEAWDKKFAQLMKDKGIAGF
ncbi:extracellular solute-binding protein [Gorillibacterium massiliense]|uniref:ABC transporter substrate-binding protein n=1 Tax=Gorillibacterium massiliense TaxID=1280390 RepID=UPI0004AD2690|nr:ABC transporter substrate-binding protein [Gorillibacterium massiliense]